MRSAAPGVRAIAPLLAGALLPLAAAGGEVALSFGDAPGGATRGFRIERRAAGAVRFEPVALVGPGVAEFVDRGLPDGNRYCYRVRSLMEGSPAWSPEVCAVAAPQAADEPAPPPSVAAPEATRAEPSEASPEAPPSSAPSPPRRIRTSGGWLQVLD